MPDINARRLPEKPDLVHEHERAKDLFKALRTNDADAIARFRSHQRFADLTPEALRAAKVKLSDAQWVIAREYGFPSWRSLKAHIEVVSGRAARVTTPYSVLMWNDNATPMEFVIHLLKTVFLKTADNARQVVFDTHHHGVGVCAVYDRLDAHLQQGFQDESDRRRDACARAHGKPRRAACRARLGR